MSLVNAYIDLRYDYEGPNNLDVNGVLVSSLQQIAPLLTTLKSQGFNSISMAVQVPIDMRTGQIYLGSFATHDNKALPQDLWKIVDYAHSLGLSVNLEALPSTVYFADGSADNADSNLNTSMSLGVGVTIDTIFQSISNYQKTIAVLAQSHGVEILTIGQNNSGYDAQAYAQYWQSNMQGIRSVYSGKIAYKAFWDNALWPLVDVVQVAAIPLISTTPIYDLATIVEGWYHANGGAGRGDKLSNYIQWVTDLSHKYSSQEILLTDYSQYALNNGIGDTVVPFDYIFNGQDISQLPAPNYREQVLAYQAFIYVAKYLLGNTIDGFGVTEFTPWQQFAWIQQNPLFKWGEDVGNDLWNRADVLQIIKQTIAINPLPHYFFSSPNNEALNGASGNLNTAVFFGSYTSSKITTGTNGVITVSNALDGTDTLANIQRLHFGDSVGLALDIGPTQTAGSVYMLYQATFNRKPDAAGLGYWINAVDKGADITKDVAALFVTSKEFVAKYGANPTNASYVDNLYQNVLHRPGEAGGVAYWNQELNAGRVTKAAVLEAFATLPEGASLVAADIASGIAYTQWVD